MTDMDVLFDRFYFHQVQEECFSYDRLTLFQAQFKILFQYIPGSLAYILIHTEYTGSLDTLILDTFFFKKTVSQYCSEERILQYLAINTTRTIENNRA